MSDAQNDNQEELGNEPGLSSAMHDIRRIARGYQQEREKHTAPRELDLGGVSMNPSFVLLPNPPARGDSWKGLALVMMVLLGLSTSALALTLHTDARMESAPMPMHIDASSLSSTVQALPDIVMASEPAIYSVSTLPGVTVQPERRDARAPISTRSEMRKAPVAVSREPAEPVDSCDEVACLLDGSDPCCQAFASVRGNESVLRDAPSRPYRPTRSEIITPMSTIKGRVASCSSRHGYKGVALVNVVIAPSGTVSSVELDDGSAAFQSCVESHVSSLEFPELSQPFTFSYPFTL